MSIRERLRKSSSIHQQLIPSSLSAAEVTDVRVVTGVALSCDDVWIEGEVHREYKIIRGVHRTVDFFRTSTAAAAGCMQVGAGGAARAAFSSPVMSRRHARITFARDGSVTVMDLGSMHGTYLRGVDFDDDDELFSEKLKPRRHYTLHSGDTIYLGKEVNRDERDWKPVAIRVLFMHDAGARFATPPPNRYGLYINTAGALGSDDDAHSISSSSAEEEDDAQSHTGTSLETSPIISHIPLQLNGVITASASRESLVSGGGVTDDGNSASAVFDLNRTISATGALRSMLPPISNIRSAIRRLPSLRELSFFSVASASRAHTIEQGLDAGRDVQSPITEASNGVGEPEAASAPTPFEPESASQDPLPKSESLQFAGGDEDGTSCSMFPWQEPSHPQNQLGLELDETAGFSVEHKDEQQEDERQSSNSSERYHTPLLVDENVVEERTEAKAIDEDDVKSMDISPASSRAASPSFHGSSVFGEVRCGNEPQSGAAEPDETSYCRCHEQAEGLPHEGVQEDSRDQEQAHPQGRQDLPPPTPAMSMPVTPERKRTISNLTTPASAADFERRRAKAARLEVAYGPIPSPVSIGRRGKRSAARLGPTRTSPTPNPPGPFGRVVRVHVDKPGAAKHPANVDTLRAKVRSLETRMKEVQGMMASVATASVTASTSASTASIDGARKEMECMRDEMRRLSGLMETLVAKMEKGRAIVRDHTDSGVQVGNQQPSKDGSTLGQSEMTPQTSGKRKRTDDLCTLGADDLDAVRLADGVSRQLHQSVPMMDRIRSFRESDVESDVRPVKRARRGTNLKDGRAVITVAAAAGFTSLGAALAWVTLAYVL